MLFPQIDRVIYQKNPLVEVVCQVRFPRILRIDTELPAAFQERIRDEYPNFAQSSAIDVGQLPAQFAGFPGLDRALGAGLRFDFASPDGVWRVSLTSQFLALTTNDYRRWEDFRKRMEGPLSALDLTYAPTFFTRVGLRYQNVIRRSVLGLDTVPWGEVLKAQVLGELARPEFESAALHVGRDLLLRLDDQDRRLRMQHGFARAGSDPEICYMIDGDFFLERQTERTNAASVLDCLNQESGKLFRWCIEKRLHDAMDPRAV